MSERIHNLNKVMAALQQPELEKQIPQESLRELQTKTCTNPPPDEPHLPYAPNPKTSSSHPYVLKPIISLPDKFNNKRLRLHGFTNQILCIIHLQPLNKQYRVTNEVYKKGSRTIQIG